MKSFCLRENRRQTRSDPPQRRSLGHVGSRFTRVKCDFFNPVTRPCTDPPTALSSFRKHGTRAHAHAHAEASQQCFSLFFAVYLQGSWKKWRLVGGCCVCFWGGGKQTRHHRITKKEGMRDRIDRLGDGWQNPRWRFPLSLSCSSPNLFFPFLPLSPPPPPKPLLISPHYFHLILLNTQ